jgi:RNA polymerase sigma-70 factor (ECF subfamily)
MDRAAVFAKQRSRLYGIAYRMLGSRADAEDMLQEAYLRWHQADAERVHTPEAHAELASDLSVAFLVVLERLAPEERAALLLHDVFDCDYADVSRILGKNEAACRQIVHRARERARRDRPRFQVSEGAHAQLLERFVSALQAQDKDTLLRLFAPDATWTSDGGGKAKAARKVVHDADRVARFALAIWRRYYSLAATHRASVNGEPGLIMSIGERVVSTISIDTDGVRIRAVHTVLNPDKLKGIAPPRAA